MTIRRLFGTLLALAVALAAALFGITVLQSETAAERTDAEHDRVTSFALSDQMRQSSNDLTRMVRLYVTTGEERYRRHYDEILAIRRGEAPRPVDYDSSYWDRVLAGAAAGAHRPARSLQSLMREAGFAAEEFTALNASLAASDALARTEREVMLHARRTGRTALRRTTPTTPRRARSWPRSSASRAWSTRAPRSAATRSRTARTACSCCRR